MSQARRRDWWLYQGLLYLLSPLLLGYTLLMSWRWRDLRYLRQRLGLGTDGDGDRLWLHAASVGEVNAALPLLRLLLDRHPDTPLLVTTSTPSGAQTLKRALGTELQHAYLPIDWPGAIARFLNAQRPRALLVMETELWPQLYRQIGQRALPLLVINARLSARTLGARPWLRRLYAESLMAVTLLLARAESDRQGYLQLGLDEVRSRTLGNIKFAGIATTQVEAISLSRPYLLLASSREEEELRVVAAWQRLEPRPLLVIAPRHPQRRETILSDLAPLKLEIALRSCQQPVSESTDLYLADTFGELAAFMLGAEVVVMGGSMVPKGGHNLLEPAALGRAVVVGPHMDNFASETALLLEHQAVLQVASDTELSTTLSRLLQNRAEREALGRRAVELMEREAGIAERYLQALIEQGVV